MFFFPFIFLLLSGGFINGSEGDLVKFWHISDFHLDLNYSDIGDINFNCHYNSSIANQTLPEYGISTMVKCDTPYILAESAIRAMKDIEAHPDFIIWTGDSAPHLEDKLASEDWVIGTLTNITSLIRFHFSTTKLYSVFGNHDYWPADQFPTYSSQIYQNASELWGTDLSHEAKTNLSRYSYYRQDLDKPKNTILIGLNTNLNYAQNNMTKDLEDPAGQFAFLESILEEAKTTGKKVMIISHIPPGLWWPKIYSLTEKHNKRLVKLLAKYSGIIIGSYFGHNHMDQFMLVRDEVSAEFISWVLATPAVNTWMGNGRNPAIRLIAIDSDSGDIRQLTQYYMKLSEANNGTVKWDKHYDITLKKDQSFLQYLKGYYEELKSGDPQKMLDYLKREYVESTEFSTCDADCRKHELCGISELMYDRYDQCIASGTSTLIESVALLVFATIVIVAAYI